MALIETTPPAVEAEEPELREIVLRLWPDDAEMLDGLLTRTGLDVSELVAEALGAYWRELDGIVLPPSKPMTLEEMDEAIRESEEDFKAGRTSTNEEVFARIDAKHGW